MKTKWGSCNIKARRIWFNLELPKKPPQCLEYIAVHEMGVTPRLGKNCTLRAGGGAGPKNLAVNLAGTQ